MNIDQVLSHNEIRWLSLNHTRKQAHRLMSQAENGTLNYFNLRKDQLPKTADSVIKIIKRDYPTLNIPYHGRCRHYEINGQNRLVLLREKYPQYSDKEWFLILGELMILSVFMDAGAGASWKYYDALTEKNFQRSEGLALASLAWYESGALSQYGQDDPLRIDAQCLLFPQSEIFESAMQISKDNPLIGSENRQKMLEKLGQIIRLHPDYFGLDGRLGGLMSYFLSISENGSLSVKRIFETLTLLFVPLFPSHYSWQGVGLGDVGYLAELDEDDFFSGVIPFHKLIQWLTYSLLEVFENIGLTLYDKEYLTGLPEYRNGGLFIDTGVLVLKSPEMSQKYYDPFDPFIVTWRALTIGLLDELSVLIRHELDVSVESLPLAKILQGGTWQAGRELAKEHRADASPPLLIEMNGTLF